MLKKKSSSYIDGLESELLTSPIHFFHTNVYSELNVKNWHRVWILFYVFIHSHLHFKGSLVATPEKDLPDTLKNCCQPDQIGLG